MIFKTYAGSMGYDPVELQQKTGIPVVALHYGDFSSKRSALYKSLRLMGQILTREARAEAVISFFEETIADLQSRSISKQTEAPSVFLGGVAFKGPHGLQATEPSYPPFSFLGANNLAAKGGLSGTDRKHTEISKEQIVTWDPELLFLDLSTLQMGEGAGGNRSGTGHQYPPPAPCRYAALLPGYGGYYRLLRYHRLYRSGGAPSDAPSYWW